MKISFLIAASALFIVTSVPATAKADCAQSDSVWTSQNGGCQDMARSVVWSLDGVYLWGDIRSYAGANQYCANLDEGGYTDWRLPTTSELQTAAMDGAGSHLYLGGTSNGHYLWWPANPKNTRNVTAVDLRSGATAKVLADRSYLYYICVRKA